MDRRDGGGEVQTGSGRLRESEGGAPKECKRKTACSQVVMQKTDHRAGEGGFGG